MKPSETPSPAPSFIGHVQNGVVILDSQVLLEDGQAVRIEPFPQAPDSPFDGVRAERVRQLQQLFAAWTDEDGQLSEEEGDRLHAALEQNRGLGLRSPPLD